jgi:hypothetical protein
MKPRVWGPYIWTSVHLVALGYPDKPTAVDKLNYKMFFSTLGNVLPCSKCTKNYNRHFAELPIDRFLDTRESLFNWTVQLHNIVNAENGLPIWSEKQAMSYYTRMVKTGKSNNDALNHENSELLIVMSVAFVIIMVGLVWFRKL